ncbi:hypothetical protein ACFPZ0_12230 [Streptomonospora nanhaiensis]|uniref:Lipoprotein n=1 Tax=Streptomonospora nanhaiensis TaxID=1323731 RepID=A0A853BQF5_9ACTN|nr:hypothetical protein [Streptomonospora nanhaiensis]MBV2364353.1 hypothetical protein [Streptomonospora nanhaiensis]MBX9389614.1 hypothetical protein [Streptomonospora nanhaiensis]NYI97240.1 hypothetical protein [Streptomonospora nanhaiensis]
MEHPRTSRRAAGAALAVAAVLALSACGGTEGGGSAAEADPNAEAAAQLNQAQLVQYGEAAIVPEHSEMGTYSRLVSTRQTERLRESTTLDKPECMDAVNAWGRLPEVRDAPASLATFARGRDTISHTLLRVPAEAAEQALSTSVPEGCGRYEAVLEDGTTASYRLEELDVAQVADGSRAFAVETEVEGETVWMYGLLYRNGDHLGATSVLGPNAEDDYRDLMVGFTRKAVEREDEITA